MNFTIIKVIHSGIFTAYALLGVAIGHSKPGQDPLDAPSVAARCGAASGTLSIPPLETPAGEDRMQHNRPAQSRRHAATFPTRSKADCRVRSIGVLIFMCTE